MLQWHHQPSSSTSLHTRSTMAICPFFTSTWGCFLVFLRGIHCEKELVNLISPPFFCEINLLSLIIKTRSKEWVCGCGPAQAGEHWFTLAGKGTCEGVKERDDGALWWREAALRGYLNLFLQVVTETRRQTALWQYHQCLVKSGNNFIVTYWLVVWWLQPIQVTVLTAGLSSVYSIYTFVGENSSYLSVKCKKKKCHFQKKDLNKTYLCFRCWF